MHRTNGTMEENQKKTLEPGAGRPNWEGCSAFCGDAAT